MIPAEILLNMDHCAKEATPITAKRDEMNKKICSRLTPQMITIDMMANKPISMLMYLITRLVLCSKDSFILANFLTISEDAIRKIKKIQIVMKVNISSCK